jgi:hypothetical protein
MMQFLKTTLRHLGRNKRKIEKELAIQSVSSTNCKVLMITGDVGFKICNILCNSLNQSSEFHMTNRVRHLTDDVTKVISL